MKSQRLPLLDRIFKFGPSQTIMRSVVQLFLLLIFYGLFRNLSNYIVDIIGFFVFSSTSDAVSGFHQDQELLIQTASLGLAMLACGWISSSPEKWRNFAPHFKRSQAGFGLSRWVSVFNDGVLKGFLISSGFLAVAAVLGVVDFEVSSFLDGRSLWLVIPHLLEQIVSFSAWLFILELFRRYLHRILVRDVDHRLIGQMMCAGFEAYFIFTAFRKSSFELNELALLAVLSFTWALGQIIAYEVGHRLTTMEHYRLSIMRFALSLGFWNALLFVYGAPLLSLKPSGFVNLLTGPLGKQLGIGIFQVDQVYFLALCSMLYSVTVFWVSYGVVRSVFSLGQTRSKDVFDRLMAEDLELQEN